ncbi:MAG: asparagine synthase B [Armatimonadetes bacterium]|nr:asparagine synthase B [Armatimonadota bacterium]NIM24226.1 asparagine synthase B [Armatimonadota bacterium]NIM68095.1 asparagine synthase B [Armatimonadota bacterium]NIM76557.1 asparagine synthase B [Armatimonadota bacterium]NIN06300.1 asparagine synthase B [Armatimonadota bacterium]
MCGIVGIASGAEIGTVKSMLDVLRHRGPDDSGIHQDDCNALGHARLSIIDIGGGKQPMSDPGDRRRVVFNGEIYNYKDLRSEIGSAEFATHSDTEVLLHLSQSGSEPAKWVSRLDGMFAFAVVQGENLTLARDPLGIKPLYLGERNGALVFGSEIKAMLVASDEVAEFPPGHVYSPVAGLQRYYTLSESPGSVTDAGQAKRGLRERLEEAVRKRLIADVSVGVFLSGGLDSSLVSAIARRHKHPLDSFAIGTEDSEDLARAREVSAYLGTRHHERVYTLKEAIALLPEVIYYLESFDCALVRSAIPNFLVAKLAQEHVKVALSGEGADELFAGYDYLKSINQDSLQDELLHITRALHNTNLQRCDRMSMAHGLEVRVPFLDIELVDFAFRMTTQLKLRGSAQTEKWILRRVAEEILPADIVWRKKVKFATGSGLGDRLAQFAEQEISDTEFARERTIGDGKTLRSKEELLYYRIFREQYSGNNLLPLVGRSRSV